MQIIIPTYRRTGSQHTYSALPEEWKRQTIFVTDKKDSDHMQSFSLYKDAKFMIVPPEITTISKKRAWIIHNIECKSMVQFDDDLIFSVRNKDAKLVKAEPENVDYWLKQLAIMLESYAHAGFSARQVNNTKPKGWELNTRMRYSLGYNPAVVRKECELGRIETREDMDVTLQLLKKGYENVVCNEIAHDQRYNAPGGVGTQRTIESSNADALKLAKLHPGLVRVAEKQYSTSIPRMEVVCSWKKALASSK